eukprot:1231562-Prymnesium_polylepis.1
MRTRIASQHVACLRCVAAAKPGELAGTPVPVWAHAQVTEAVEVALQRRAGRLGYVQMVVLCTRGSKHSRSDSIHGLILKARVQTRAAYDLPLGVKATRAACHAREGGMIEARAARQHVAWASPGCEREQCETRSARHAASRASESCARKEHEVRPTLNRRNKSP